jgi:membrane protein
MVSKRSKIMTRARFRLLLEAVKKFDRDHGFFLSSGITFNLLLCIIPFILLLLSLVGVYLYSSREVLNYVRHYLETMVPSLDPTITRDILRITRDRKIVGILGIGGLIWTCTWVFSSMRTAFNIIFQVKKERGILRGKAIDVLMIFLAGIALLLSMTLTSGITFLQGFQVQPLIAMGPILRWVLKYIVPFFFTYSMFFLIYKIIPNRKISVSSAFQAALFASLLWEATKHLFGWYVLHLGRFSMVYGSLSTLIIFFLWIYYSSAVLLLGGEIAFLLEEGQPSSHRRTGK